MERVTHRGLLFLLTLLVVLTLLLTLVVLPFLAFVFFGAFAAFLVWPLHVRLKRLVGTKVSVFALVALIYAAIFVPLTLLAWSVIRDISTIVARIREEGIEEYLHSLLDPLLPAEFVDQAAQWLASAAIQAAARAAPRLLDMALHALLGFFIFGFIVFYCLLYGKEVMDFLRGLMPLRDHRVDSLFRQASLSLHAVFYGVILVAAIQAAAGTVVWWISGLPNPFFWGAIMFVLSILPFAGPSFVLLPAAAWSFMQGQVGLAFFLALSGVVLVGGIDNVLRPFLVARFGDINPAMVVVGLAGGLVAFGVVGMVLGPLIFALWVAVARELRGELGIWKKEMFGPRERHADPEDGAHRKLGSPPPGTGGTRGSDDPDDAPPDRPGDP